jgi:hypothetical protein
MSPLLVQRIVGHSDISMTEHYFHANNKDLSDGINQMPNFTTDAQEGVCKDETAEVMDLLAELKEERESPLQCLKRLAALAKPYSVAS